MKRQRNGANQNFRSAAFLMTLASCVIFVVGCSRTALERTTKEIKQGMTQEQISKLFKDFNASAMSDYNGALHNYSSFDSNDKMVAFKTNAFVGFQVSYGPSRREFFSSFEICTIYYDTNKIVIGYHYNLDH